MNNTDIPKEEWPAMDTKREINSIPFLRSSEPLLPRTYASTGSFHIKNTVGRMLYVAKMQGRR